VKEECTEIRALLDPWLDGELSTGDRRRVARHVEGCAACREEAEALGRMNEALRDDDHAGDPGNAYFAGLGDRISARFDFAEAETHWAKPADPPRRRTLAIPRVWIPRIAFGVTGTAVILIAGYLVHDIGDRPEPMPRVPAAPDVVYEPTAREQAAPIGVPDAVPDARPRKGETGAPRNEALRKEEAMPSRAMHEEVKVAPPPAAGTGPVAKDQEEVLSVDGAAFESRVASAHDDEDRLGSAAQAPPEAIPSRPELLTFFRTALEARDTRPNAPAAAEGRGDTPSRRIPNVSSSPEVRSLRAKDAPALPQEAPAPARASGEADSTWVRTYRDRARILAELAHRTQSLEGCEAALAEYWRMLHRDGRLLAPDPAALQKALDPDRARIEDLMRCAAR
jgi:hypothetical protein